jgi:hypothetical protein
LNCYKEYEFLKELRENYEEWTAVWKFATKDPDIVVAAADNKNLSESELGNQGR